MGAHEPRVPANRAGDATAEQPDPLNISATALGARVRAPSIVLSHASP